MTNLWSSFLFINASTIETAHVLAFHISVTIKMAVKFLKASEVANQSLGIPSLVCIHEQLLRCIGSSADFVRRFGQARVALNEAMLHRPVNVI